MATSSTYTHHISSILRVLLYIEDHLDEPLSLEKMAKLARVSPFYFHRLFRAYVGETLTEYVKRLRLQNASGRLQYSNVPITEIALDAGYETPSAFTKVFNQVMGQSPRHYRKQMQPLIQSIIERTTINKEEKIMLQPEFINRKDEPVLFVRYVGEYSKTAPESFHAIINFVHKKNISKVNAYYSFALDDPNIVEKNKCRFDACAAMPEPIPVEGEFGKKVIPGGRFAVFVHRGPYANLEMTFEKIFRSWYPNSQETLANAKPFCEHINVEDKSLPDSERITKIYIPIV